MRGFELDSDLKKRLKIGKAQLGKVGSAIKSGLDTMHSSGPKTGPAAMSNAGVKPPAEKTPAQGRRNVRPKDIAADTLVGSPRKPIGATPAVAPDKQPRKPSFNAQDTIPRNLERFDLGSTLKDIYKKNASKFGPDTKTGGRDIYEMKGGERTGRILESSDWLPEGKAFSNNAWEETVGGQPNMNYDPKAIMPEGYTNDAGTFIPGPRVNPWDVGGLVAHSGARTPEERKSAFDKFNALAGQLDPETGRIGSERARRGEQKLEGIKGRYLESAAKIRANADVTAAGLQADAYTAKGEGGGQYAPKGYQSVTDEEGNLSVFDKDTGTYSAPGAELPEHVKKHFENRKFKSKEEFENELQKYDEITRKKIRALVGSK